MLDTTIAALGLGGEIGSTDAKTHAHLNLVVSSSPGADSFRGMVNQQRATSAAGSMSGAIHDGENDAPEPLIAASALGTTSLSTSVVASNTTVAQTGALVVVVAHETGARQVAIPTAFESVQVSRTVRDDLAGSAAWLQSPFFTGPVQNHSASRGFTPLRQDQQVTVASTWQSSVDEIESPVREDILDKVFADISSRSNQDEGILESTADLSPAWAVALAGLTSELHADNKRPNEKRPRAPKRFRYED